MQNDLLKQFISAAELYSGKEAVVYKEDNSWKKLTYSDIEKEIRSCAGSLRSKGIGKGDNVILMLSGSSHWPVIFLAISSLGAVNVPVNVQAGRRELDHIIGQTEPKLVLVEKDICSEEALKEINEKIPANRIIETAREEFRALFVEGGENAEAGGIGEDAHVSPDDPACILYTSGTTGEPKGVMLTHGNFLANCESLNKRGIIQKDDKVISMLPLHHAYPITITVLLPLLYGAGIVFSAGIRPEDIGEALENGKPTVFISVPQFYHGMHRKITDKLNKIPFPVRIILRSLIEISYGLRKLTGLNLSKIILGSAHKKFGRQMRLYASGGAKLNEKVISDLLKFGFVISEGYGLSETAPVLTFNSPEKPKIGSAGTSVPGVEIKVKDPDENGIGEVIARGENIMKGYYKRDDLTQDVIKDGWFHTGDLGYLDKDGYLFLTGRAKDLIVLSSGLNILPSEIEEEYMKDLPVKEICVFDVPSPKGIEADIVLWAVIRPDLEPFKKYGEVNLKSVIKERLDNISRTLPPQNRIMGFSVTLEELPRTSLGKLKRFEIKDKYSPEKISKKDISGPEGSVEGKSHEMDKNETFSQIKKVLKENMGIKSHISPSDSLELDLGIDSLGRVELASCLEKAFSVKIPDEAVTGAFTVSELVANLESILDDPSGREISGSHPDKGDENYWSELFKTSPEKENLEKIDLSPGIFSWLAGFIFLLPFFIFFKLFCRLKVEGKENVKNMEKCILYANHTSYFDGLLMGVSFKGFPRLDLFFIGFRMFFDVPIIRHLIKLGRIIPIDMVAHLTEALRSCYYVLDNGKNLCIFPEGKRTIDGRISDFKKGFGIIAHESGAKLIPVAIEGAYESWPRTSKFPRPHPVKIKFGKPVEASVLEEAGRKKGESDAYSAICRAAQDKLKELKQNEPGTQ